MAVDAHHDWVDTAEAGEDNWGLIWEPCTQRERGNGAGAEGRRGQQRSAGQMSPSAAGQRLIGQPLQPAVLGHLLDCTADRIQVKLRHILVRAADAECALTQPLPSTCRERSGLSSVGGTSPAGEQHFIGCIRWPAGSAVVESDNQAVVREVGPRCRRIELLVVCYQHHSSRLGWKPARQRWGCQASGVSTRRSEPGGDLIRDRCHCARDCVQQAGGPGRRRLVATSQDCGVDSAPPLGGDQSHGLCFDSSIAVALEGHVRRLAILPAEAVASVTRLLPWARGGGERVGEEGQHAVLGTAVLDGALHSSGREAVTQAVVANKDDARGGAVLSDKCLGVSSLRRAHGLVGDQVAKSAKHAPRHIQTPSREPRIWISVVRERPIVDPSVRLEERCAQILETPRQRPA